MSEYDWPTIRAVSNLVGLDPHEVERLLGIGDPPIIGTGCWWRNETWSGHFCGRSASKRIAGLALCWQHENSFIRTIDYWVRHEIENRDISDLIEALNDRLRRRANAAMWNPDEQKQHARLQEIITEYLDRDTVEGTREALTAVWGTS